MYDDFECIYKKYNNFKLLSQINKLDKLIKKDYKILILDGEFLQTFNEICHVSKDNQIIIVERDSLTYLKQKSILSKHKYKNKIYLHHFGELHDLIDYELNIRCYYFDFMCSLFGSNKDFYKPLSLICYFIEKNQFAKDKYISVSMTFSLRPGPIKIVSEVLERYDSLKKFYKVQIERTMNYEKYETDNTHERIYKRGGSSMYFTSAIYNYNEKYKTVDFDVFYDDNGKKIYPGYSNRE